MHSSLCSSVLTEHLRWNLHAIAFWRWLACWWVSKLVGLSNLISTIFIGFLFFDKKISFLEEKSFIDLISIESILMDIKHTVHPGPSLER